MSEEEVAAIRKVSHETKTADAVVATSSAASSPATLVIAWLVVGLPLAWGVWVTLQKASVLFK
jgi:hypothetical protein